MDTALDDVDPIETGLVHEVFYLLAIAKREGRLQLGAACRYAVRGEVDLFGIRQ